ncbi:hypothetical protein D8Z03_25350 [Salmonella enterica]|nr:hypothetical protein [Salmonella enterica subsp. diarizonae serovar 17:z10:e,n,x,z15]
MNNKVSRGFHRIGLVVAAIIFVVAVIFTLSSNSASVSADGYPARGVPFSLILDLISSFIIAAVVYGFIRLIGWAVNGFSGGDSAGELAVADPATVAAGNIQYTNDRQVSRLLWVGILLLPIIFVWFLFRKGYPTSTRGWGLIYLVLSLWFGYHFTSEPEVAVVHPRISSSYAPTRGNTNSTDELSSAYSGRPDSTKLAEFNAKDIEQAYADNTVAADNQFKDKWLIVSGVAGEISTDIFGHGYITLKTDEFDINAPEAVFIDSEKSKLSRIKKGQHIRAECIGAGDVAKTPMLKECTMLDML